MRRPLDGLRILVTRARIQASDLVERLESLGAEPIVMPSIEIAAPLDARPLLDSLARLTEFDWMVFTSTNGVRAVLDCGIPLDGPKIAAVGPATASALERAGYRVDVVPTSFMGSAVPDAMGEIDGQRILWPRGDLARGEFVAALIAGGATVLAVEAYRTLAAPWPKDPLPVPDLLTFTSSSGVLSAHERLSERGLLGWLETVPIVCIGPVTADTVRCLGYSVAMTASEHTIPGLVEAVVAWAKR
jgi:uroporphyrinogen-III synthase